MARVLSIVSVLLFLLIVPAATRAQERFDLLVRGGRVIDGTGNPWFYADVGIRDGRIVSVGPLTDATATRVLNAEGRVVTPGFIDLHSTPESEARNGGHHEA